MPSDESEVIAGESLSVDLSARPKPRHHEAGSCSDPAPSPLESIALSGETNQGHEMRFSNTPHQHYCGGDLHARTLFLHILDPHGKTCFEQNLPASPTAFLEAVKPFREGLVVGVECMFGVWSGGTAYPTNSPRSAAA